jgi:hypothetical protein
MFWSGKKYCSLGSLTIVFLDLNMRGSRRESYVGGEGGTRFWENWERRDGRVLGFDEKRPRRFLAVAPHVPTVFLSPAVAPGNRASIDPFFAPGALPRFLDHDGANQAMETARLDSDATDCWPCPCPSVRDEPGLLILLYC